jgi:hypothetical protein
MLINLSNHPSNKWSPEQLQAATQFGEIIDLPFPNISPNGDEAYIQVIVKEYMCKIDDCIDKHCPAFTPVTVHIMGEMTFAFAMIDALQQKGMQCIASTTERIVNEKDGLKASEFRFVKFREYGKLR